MSTPQLPNTDAQQQDIPDVGFLVMAFCDEDAADRIMDAMGQTEQPEQFHIKGATVIRQDAHGKVHYYESGDMSPVRGATVGALIGGILGILGGPAGIVAGFTLGAAIGAGVGSVDKGSRNESLSTLGVALKPGTSAIAAITSHDFLRAVEKEVPIEAVRAAVRDLAAQLSARLGEGSDVAVGLLLTEAGLSMKELAVHDESGQSAPDAPAEPQAPAT